MRKIYRLFLVLLAIVVQHTAFSNTEVSRSSSSEFDMNASLEFQSVQPGGKSLFKRFFLFRFFDSKLDTLYVPGQSFQEEFDPKVYDYHLTVDFDVSHISLVADPRNSRATYRIRDGINYSIIYNEDSIPLDPGLNELEVVVYPPIGWFKTIYRVHVERRESPNPNLSSIILSEAELSPDFNPDSLNYSGEVPNEIDTVNFSITTEYPGATYLLKLTGSGTTISEQNVPLAVGQNAFTIEVTSADGLNQKNYSVSVDRKQSNNIRLSELSVSGATLTPNLDPNIFTYQGEVDSGIYVNFHVVPEDPNATYEVKNKDKNWRIVGETDVKLDSLGVNKFAIVVEAPDETKQIYNVNLTRTDSTINTLDSLYATNVEWDTVFTPTFSSYNGVLEEGALIDLNITLTDPNGRYAVKDIDKNYRTIDEKNIYLEPGLNRLFVIVFGADNVTKRQYFPYITRLDSGISELKKLVVKAGKNALPLSPEFDPARLTYDASTAFSVEKISFELEALDEGAIVELKDKDENWKIIDTKDVPLDVGLNRFAAVVTALDSSKAIYNINVTRNDPDGDDYRLSSLVVSNTTLDPLFDPFVRSYRGNTTAEFVDFTVATNDASTTFEIVDVNDGDQVISGVDVKLLRGINKYEIRVVTANGTKKTTTLDIFCDKDVSGKESFAFSAEKFATTPNATGMQLGFWPNFNRHDIVLEHFGKRTMGRGAFGKWQNFETTVTGQGNYDFSKAFTNAQRHHRFGESVIQSINLSFSPEIQTKNNFPPFYYPRITDPTSRQAAKDFLYAYVQEGLNTVGELYLSIDYEIVFNYRLYLDGADSTLSRQYANEWSAWYVEAAAVARQAAADIGKSDDLILIPIVNANPFREGTILQGGRANNQWLVDVMAVSDILGIDAYTKFDSVETTDPITIIEIIKHWTENYSDGKPVIMVENGFSSAKENVPDAELKGKYIGTEAEQAIYMERIFDELVVQNQTGGGFNNQLRGFLHWTIIDNQYGGSPGEEFFGLLSRGSTQIPKPAYYPVVDAFQSMEADNFHRPFNVGGGTDITSLVNTSTNHAVLEFTKGDEFEKVVCTLNSLQESTAYRLYVEATSPGALVLNINNGSKWLHLADELNTKFDLDVSSYMIPGADNTVELYFTSDVFPFTQQVKEIRLYNDSRVSFDLPFFDDFSEGDANWTVAQGTWNINNEIYEGTGAATSFTGSDSWSDYIMYLEAKTTEPGNARFKVAQPRFRYKNESNHYFINIFTDGELALVRNKNGTKTTLQSVTGTGLDPTEWNSFKITAIKDTIKCSINGTEYINVIDSEPLLTGKVALRSNQANLAQFNEILVVEPGFIVAELPFFDNFEDGNAKWDELVGSWSIANGLYQTSGSSWSAVAGLTDWTDYESNIRMKTDQLGTKAWNAAQFAVRFQDPDNHYRFFVRNDEIAQIIRYKNSIKTVLVSVNNTGIDPKQWNDYKVVANQDTLQFYVNDSLYIDYVDSTDAILDGKVALRSNDAALVSFDEVHVLELTSGSSGARLAGTENANDLDLNSDDAPAFTMYPNPLTIYEDKLSIIGKMDGGELEVRIVDINGKQVYEKAFSLTDSGNLVQLDLSKAGVKKGLYIVHIDIDRVRHTRKLMIE